VTHLKGDLGLWALTGGPSPAAREYVAHLRELRNGGEGDDRAALLLAHAYTRYLGDLSGGRVLLRAARKLLRGSGRSGANDNDGLSFYVFDRVPNPKAFKNAYRARLDSLPLSAAAADALVDEANVAFVMNTRLFQQLDVAAGLRAAVDPAEVLLRNLKLPASERAEAQAAAEAAAAGCPFAGLAAQGVPVPASHAKFMKKSAPASGKEGKKCPMPFRVLHDPLCVCRDPDAIVWGVAVVGIVGFFMMRA